MHAFAIAIHVDRVVVVAAVANVVNLVVDVVATRTLWAMATTTATYTLPTHTHTTHTRTEDTTTNWFISPH